MGDTTARRAERKERMVRQVEDAFEHPLKTLGMRVLVSIIVAVITGGISAYVSVQIISQEVAGLSNRQDQIAVLQQQEFQELSQRIDHLADDPPHR